MAALRRVQLEAVGYPEREKVDLSTNTGLHALAVWLEDTRIRALPESDRAPLRRDAAASGSRSSEEEPTQSLQSYLQELGCSVVAPANAEERLSVASFLLNQAVSLDVQDNASSCRAAAERVAKRAHGAASSFTVDASLPFGDMHAKQVVQRISAAANKAGVSLQTDQQHDALIASRALSRAVRQHLASEVLAAAWKPSSDRSSLDAFPLGFSMEGASERAHAAARVLRLLYINDLRELQTSVDRLIVSAQDVSADPKTDSKNLGKVGK